MAPSYFVSIIITTFNRPHLLQRAIESVLNQSYKNFELIIIDDCSTDTTQKVVKNYINEKVHYIKNIENKGLSASRNIGIKASRGEYISFLDDDDELLPDKLFSQIELFKTNKYVDVVYCGSIKKYKNFSLINPAKYKGCLKLSVLNSCPNAVHSLLIKKTCFNRVGLFDENLNALEDWDMWIRLSKFFEFDYVPKNLIIYYIHGSQMSTHLRLKTKAREKLFLKHYDSIVQNKHAHYWHLRKLAGRFALLNEFKRSLKYIIKSILVKPLNAGSYFHLFLLLSCPPFYKKIVYKYGFLKIGDITLV